MNLISPLRIEDYFRIFSVVVIVSNTSMSTLEYRSLGNIFGYFCKHVAEVLKWVNLSRKHNRRISRAKKSTRNRFSGSATQTSLYKRIACK